MEYNTSRPQMTIPEYGRNIQNMIKYAVALPTREERNTAAKTIVSAMTALNPQIRDLTDYKQVLWDHLFIISDFELDCDSPYPLPERDTIHVKPKHLAYPQKNIKQRHYGSLITQVIKEAKGMEEGPDKQKVAAMIANFMKHLYLTWNRDSVTDEVIFDQLKTMSGGTLIVPEGTKLSAVYVEPRDNGMRRPKRSNNNRKRNGNDRRR